MRKYYAFIADIHGNIDALARAVHRLRKWEQAAGIHCTKVFMGDYIDRGPDPSGVLDAVRWEVEHGAVALLGNHDDMLTGTVEDRMVPFGSKEYPLRMVWDRNGGLDTCRVMFGDLPRQEGQENPPGVLDYVPLLRRSWQYEFLSTLPLTFETDNLFVSHSPQISKEFGRKELLWGSDALRNHAYIVPNNKQGAVHGHMASKVQGDKLANPFFTFPVVRHFEHGGRIKFIALCDVGCDGETNYLRPVVISDGDGGAQMEAII